jgi:hypothetical protein
MTDEHDADRRSFLRTGAIAGAALVAGATAMAQQLAAETNASSSPPTKGDIAILSFLAAAEILETDLWEQYNELGGIQDKELPGGSGNPAYTKALKKLDGDMDQYIHDNTEDEFTHQNFINHYLVSISPPSSKAAAASTRRWPRRSPTQRSCSSCSVSARPKPCTSRPGRTRRATHLL